MTTIALSVKDNTVCLNCDGLVIGPIAIKSDGKADYSHYEYVDVQPDAGSETGWNVSLRWVDDMGNVEDHWETYQVNVIA